MTYNLQWGRGLSVASANMNNKMRGSGSPSQVIMDPSRYHPSRIPSFPNMERTAVLPFKAVGTVTTDGLVTTQGVMLMNVPCAPAWVSTSATSCRVDYHEPAVNNVIDSTRGTFLTSGSWQPNSLNTWGSITVEDAQVPIGMVGNDACIYIPAGALPYVRVEIPDMTSMNGNLIADLKWWVGGSSFRHTGLTLSVSGNAYIGVGAPMLDSVWMRIDTISTDMNTTINATDYQYSVTAGWLSGGSWALPTGTVRIWKVLASLPEAANSLVPWADTRATAVSCRVTNTSRVMDKEGSLYAARLNIDRNANLFANFSTDDLSSVHPDFRYFGPLERGVFTFMPPTANSGRFAPAYLAESSGLTHLPCFELSAVDFVHAIIFDDPANDSRTRMSVMCDWHIEFRCSSTIFDAQVCKLPLEAYHKAILDVSKRPLFYPEAGPSLGQFKQYLPAKTPRPAPLPSRQSRRRQRRARQAAQPPKVELTVQKTQPQPRRKGGLEIYLASKRK